MIIIAFPLKFENPMYLTQTRVLESNILFKSLHHGYKRDISLPHILTHSSHKKQGNPVWHVEMVVFIYKQPTLFDLKVHMALFHNCFISRNSSNLIFTAMPYRFGVYFVNTRVTDCLNEAL